MDPDASLPQGLPKTAITIFGALDFLLAWVPLGLGVVVCYGFTALSLFAIAGSITGFWVFILSLAFASVLSWLARGVYWAICWRREPDFPDARKGAVRKRLGVLLVLAVVINVWVFSQTGVEEAFISMVVTMGFVYTPVRHFLLMYHDRLREQAGT